MKKVILSILALLITVLSYAIPPITGPTSICLGSSVLLSDAATPGFWGSLNPSVATVGMTSGIVTGVSLGTATITYTSGGISALTTVTVFPVPAPVAGPTSLVLGGSSITLTDPTPGGNWSSPSSPLIGGIDYYSGVVTPSFNEGVLGITYTLPGGCYVYYSVTVYSTPITGTNHVCVGSSTTLSGTTGSGGWSVSDPSIASISITSGVVVTGLAAGTCIITFANSGAYVTFPMTVNPLPATISGGTTVVAGSTLPLTDLSPGGSWTSSNPAVATVGIASGIVAGVAGGTANITYTLSTGCYDVHTVTVTGIMAITGTSSACAGSSSTLADATPGGTWSSSNPSIATVVSTTGVVTGVSAGTCTITYSVGTSYVTRSFTVNSVPGAISGPATVVAGSTITLTDGTPGGSWISGNTSIATVSATGVVTGVSAGTVSIYYSSPFGCAVYRTVTVTGVTVAAITGTFSVCAGSVVTLTDATTGGTWSSSNTAIATAGASTGVITGIAAGSCTITYTVGASYVTHSFTVNPLPAAIAGPATVAVGSTITLTDATTGGTWSSSNTAIATVSTTGIVTGVATGTVTIYYTSAAGCAVAYSVTVTGITSVITGTTHVCVGSTITLSDPAPGGTWSSSNTAIATVGLTTGIVTGVAAGTCLISYNVGTSHVSVSFTVNPLPAAIAGSSTVCTGASVTLTDAAPGGIWSSSSTGIATVGSATGVVSGVSGGSVSISYVLTTGCSATKALSVNPVAGAISGGSTVCLGSTITLTDAVPGGTWMSVYTSYATIGSSTGIVTGVAVGSTTIIYTVGGCSATKTITVNAAPAAIGGSTSVCAGSSIALTDATPGGTWSSGITSIATVSTTGLVTGVSSGVVIIDYSVGGCFVSKSVTVNPVPAAITGSSTVHTSGSPITLTDVTTGGSWFSGNPSLATVGALTGVVSGVSAGSVNIYYSRGGCAVSKTITVISPAPPAPGNGGNGTTDVAGNFSQTNGVSEFAGNLNEETPVNPGSATVIGQTEHNGTITLYPNPTTGIINMEWANQVSGNATIAITDIAGHEVFKSGLTINGATGISLINASNLRDGLYLITIKTESGSFTSRLIIQH